MTRPPRQAAVSRGGGPTVQPAFEARGAAPASAPAKTRDDVRSRLRATVDVARLPRPPRSGAEWRERADVVYATVPSLVGQLADAPLGWFPLIERAAREIVRMLPRTEVLITSQVKEKYGTLRWYAHVATIGSDMGSRWDDAVLGAVAWAEEASAQTCAVFGTADGTLDLGGGWWLTLSPEAIAIRRRDDDTLRDLLYPGWTRD